MLEHFLDHAKDSGFTVLGLTYSPIRGPEGNIEYLVYLRKCEEGKIEKSVDIHAVVEAAHGDLDK